MDDVNNIRLRREQERLNGRESGSKNEETQRIVVARLYERVFDQRNDLQQKLAREYVNNYDLIATEKIRPLHMVKNSRFARSISDASWASFNDTIAYKAENAGKPFIQVDARGTSQTCLNRGAIAPKSIYQRVHDRPCGYQDTRDHASSLVIPDRGLKKVRSERPELTLVDNRPIPAIEHRQAEWMKQESLS